LRLVTPGYDLDFAAATLASLPQCDAVLMRLTAENQTMPAPTDNRVTLSRELELERVIPVGQAAELMGISEDTFRRKHADKIIEVSDRRRGVRLKHALLLSA
jgi:hypothetical protein